MTLQSLPWRLMSEQTLRGLQQLLVEHPLVVVGFLLVFGYAIGKLAGRFRLPEITGFIVSGLLVGLCMPPDSVTQVNGALHVVTEVAIGFLALSIGGELAARKMRRIGRDILVISMVQLIMTLAAVVIGLWLLGMVLPDMRVGLPYIMLLAVIACAASPAVIVAEVHHLRAHGKFIDYLFGVVALGDTVTVVMFGLAFTLITNLIGAPQGANAVLYRSLAEIVGALLLGLAAALPMHALGRRIRNPNERLIVVTGTVFLVSGVAVVLHLSPLLVNMVLGAVLINISSKNMGLLRVIEPLTPPIYALFFVIAGLEINLSVFAHQPALLLGAGYIVLRGIGKYAGARLGCRLRGVAPSITRNLGWCMFSKGGVALGFVLLIQTSPALAELRGQGAIFVSLTNLVNVIFMSIFVNELLSPFFLRYAVVRGNEME